MSRITYLGQSDDVIMVDNENSCSAGDLTTPPPHDHFQMYDLDDGSSSISMPLMNDGSRWKMNGHWEQQCPWCGEWVDQQIQVLRH